MAKQEKVSRQSGEADKRLEYQLDFYQITGMQMGLFSKINPERTHDSIVRKIVLAALEYRLELSSQNKLLSADAGAELIYLLVHVIDRTSFDLLGTTKRNQIVDKISELALIEYLKAILAAETPQEVTQAILLEMLSKLNSRQSVYGQCSSFIGEGFAGKGTVLFAFTFYVHKAMGLTNLENPEPYLIGSMPLNQEELKAFPSVENILKTSIVIGSLIPELNFNKDLVDLK